MHKEAKNATLGHTNVYGQTKSSFSVVLNFI